MVPFKPILEKDGFVMSEDNQQLVNFDRMSQIQSVVDQLATFGSDIYHLDHFGRNTGLSSGKNSEMIPDESNSKKATFAKLDDTQGVGKLGSTSQPTTFVFSDNPLNLAKWPSELECLIGRDHGQITSDKEDKDLHFPAKKSKLQLSTSVSKS